MSRTTRIVALLAVAIVLGAAVATILLASGPRGPLVPFNSYADLSAYLDRARSAPNGDFLPLEGWSRAEMEGPASGVADYSRTNVQVEGVDELDIVKTDGVHAYVASGPNVTILRAHPPGEMAVVAILSPAFPGDANVSYPTVTGLFVDGTLLGVVSTGYTAGDASTREGLTWFPGASWTFVSIYDVSSPAAPELRSVAAVSGYPLAGRMIAPHVYVITNDWVQRLEDGYRFPEACEGTDCAALPPAAIYYDPESRDAAYFTNVLAVNLTDGAFTATSVVTGYASTLYMSTSALYLTFTKWGGGEIRILPFVEPTGVATTIHKVAIAGIAVAPLARADVPGYLLNQFSLDEHAGYLRVATTSWTSGERTSQDVNNVYVLDATAMEVVGRLEGLAPGETIHSARFMGDRAYLVTFQKIDPFFVIDLSDPAAPRVLGYLKIPGFSDYLHPVGEHHVLGIGKDAVPADEGNFSWFQGLKLSLFDVEDVENPTEVARYAIGDRGTDSDALRDHRALLFDAERGLLVLPVALAEIDPAMWPDPMPPWAYGELVWQGAYVFDVSPTAGFELRGRITHLDEIPESPEKGYLDWGRFVQRSFSIGDVLYTLSPTVLKANALGNLAELNSVVYAAGYDWSYRYIG